MDHQVAVVKEDMEELCYHWEWEEGVPGVLNKNKSDILN